MKKSIIFLIGLLSLCLLIGSAAADPQLIDGYYQIGSVSDLQWFATLVNAGHVTYNAKLTSDIDLAGISWTPIGTTSNPYTGTFNGDGHVIKNLYGRPTQNNYGLFGVVRGSTIQKVGLIDVDIDSTTAIYIGGIVGATQDVSGVPITTISECFVEGGSIRSVRFVGGIAGSTVHFLISDCYVSSTDIISIGLSTGAHNGEVGGITAFGRSGDIRNCYVASDVLHNYHTMDAGIQYGIVPYSTTIQGDSYIDSCVFIGDVATYKIWGELNTYYGSGSLTCRNNYALNGGTSKSSQNGLAKTSQELHSQSFYTTSSNWGDYPWDFTNTWYWNAEENLPKLRAFLPNQPTIEAVTLTSSTPAPLSDAITATVSATSPGGSALSYQWHYSTNGGSTWNTISGATSASLSFQPQETGTYTLKVVVTDASGSTDSYGAGFTNVNAQVVTAPTLGTATINMEHGALQTPYNLQISFTLTDLGGATSVYTRLQYSTDGTTWSSTGATTRRETGTYYFTQTVNDNTATTHYYRIIAASIEDIASTTATSNTVTFQTFAAPVISDITVPDKVQVGTPFTFSASATDAQTVTYQLSSNSGSTWTNITSPHTIQTAGTYQFRVSATGYGGTTTSTPHIITAYVLPVISTNPIISLTQGPLVQTVTLNIDTSGISGTAPLSYQWQEQLSGVWTNIASGTSIPLIVSVSDTVGTAHTYRLVVSNIGGSTPSSTVTYQSYAPPVFSSVSVSPTTSAVPATITFSATATDATSIIYQLSPDEITWSQVTSPYTINQAGTYYFRALATGYGGQTYSDTQTITVSDLVPVIESAAASPTSGLVPFSVTFTASATNNPTYTWYQRVDGLDQQIGTGSRFVYQLRYGLAAGEYKFRVKAHNEYGDAYSPDISVTVGALPGTIITAPSSGSSFMQRQPITFTASSSSQFATTYSWRFSDGSTASGASVSHSFQDVGDASATVTGTNQFGSDSATVRLQISEYSAVSVSVSDISAVGAKVTGLIGESSIDPTTKMHFEIMSKSGTVLWKTDDKLYSQSNSFTAEGMPLISGQMYKVRAVTDNYGSSVDVSFTLNEASRNAPEKLGTVYESSGLNRDPFNVTKLVDGSTTALGSALGGGTVGKAIAFGVIVLFLVVGIWLRQGDVIIPVTIGLAGGWFVIGNLPGEWQPVAYTILVVSIVAIFWVIFKKRVE